MNRIAYAVVVFFSGFAMVLGILIFVYVIVLAMDKITHPDTLTVEELEERRTAPDLTRRAGLAGLISSERSRVYRRFFEKISLTYHKIEEEKDDDIEAQKIKYQGKTKTDTPSTDVDVSAVKDKKSEIEETETKTKTLEDASATEMKAEGQEEEAGDFTCPICLNDYVEGNKVITGTACSHMFHFECCMQWLEKGNEQCPYCRKDMMTAEDLYEAAREELGDARVEKLKRVNAEGSRPLAENQASTPGNLRPDWYANNMQGSGQSILIGAVWSPTTRLGDGNGNGSRSGNTEETSARGSAVEATASNPIAPSDTTSDVPNGESAQTSNDAENEEPREASTSVDTEDGVENECITEAESSTPETIKDLENNDVPNQESIPASKNDVENEESEDATTVEDGEDVTTVVDTADGAEKECTTEAESSTQSK